jgi:uncharacterized protein involved in exopolysaccharide biosynthesis
MFRISPSPGSLIFDTHQAANPGEAVLRSNRRRLLVFFFVFVLTLAPGLTWNLLRPAEYRATARLEISAGTVSPRVDATRPGFTAVEPAGQKGDLLTQAQILTSRDLIEEAVRRLDREGNPAASAGTDRIAALQNAIAASPLPGTDIVELAAIGESPLLMAKLVNTLIASYRDQLLGAHDNASRTVIVNLRDEIEKLGNSITEKRAQLAAFRLQSGVISSERTENEALARIKGLAESLNKANEDAARAEARLRTLHESAATGRSPVLSKDNPTLASIEQRISITREQLRDMERTYTPAFMAMDPDARALKARLAELEQQISATRAASQQAALAAATEDAAETRSTVERLRQQIAGLRREAQIFSGNFQEARGIEDDLGRLEEARRGASERLAKLEASENGRLPNLTVIEAASVPQKPWRPDYWRDALINLVASFVLGLLAIWFIELFNRSPLPTPAGATTVVMPAQAWMTPSLANEQAMPRAGLAGPDQTIPQLSSKAILPRELSQVEAGALLRAADGDGRLLCAFLLLGLTVEELKDLTLRDIDLTSSRLALRGSSARTISLPDWIAPLLANHANDDEDKPLFRNSLGQSLSQAEIEARLTCAAHDAGIEAVASITPDVLRHTYIANLVRQNVRFSSLPSLAGYLSADELAAYAALSQGPRGTRGDAVDPIMPALRAAGTA